MTLPFFIAHKGATTDLLVTGAGASLGYVDINFEVDDESLGIIRGAGNDRFEVQNDALYEVAYFLAGVDDVGFDHTLIGRARENDTLVIPQSHSHSGPHANVGRDGVGHKFYVKLSAGSFLTVQARIIIGSTVPGPTYGITGITQTTGEAVATVSIRQVTATLFEFGQGDISGDAVATGVGRRTATASSVISGNTSIVANARKQARSDSSISGDAIATAIANEVETPGFSPISGNATATGAAIRQARADASISGNATATATARKQARADSSISGDVVTAAAARKQARADSSISGNTTGISNSQRTRQVDSSISGDTVTAAAARKQARADSSISGDVITSAVALAHKIASASISGNAIGISNSQRTRQVDSSIFGNALISAVGRARFRAVDSLVQGVGQVTGTGTRRQTGIGIALGYANMFAVSTPDPPPDLVILDFKSREELALIGTLISFKETILLWHHGTINFDQFKVRFGGVSNDSGFFIPTGGGSDNTEQLNVDIQPGELVWMI